MYAFLILLIGKWFVPRFHVGFGINCIDVLIYNVMRFPFKKKKKKGRNIHSHSLGVFEIVILYAKNCYFKSNHIK
jgi:hypothetical protein